MGRLQLNGEAMQLSESIEVQGNWLFRHRGILPLLLLPLIAIAVRSVELREVQYGEQFEILYQTIGLLVATCGLMLRSYVVGSVPRGTSGRNTARQEAASFNTTGWYSIVRNPLYLGNYLIVLGCTVFVGSWWLPVVSTLLFWPYYERIVLAEEAFLMQSFGVRFREWASQTPAFLPRIGQWQPPALAFSWRTALKREYGTLLVIISVCSLSEVVGDLIFEPRPQVEWGWSAVFLGGLVVCLTLRAMKRKTKLLTVEGRP